MSPRKTSKFEEPPIPLNINQVHFNNVGNKVTQSSKTSSNPMQESRFVTNYKPK
jgi:hypothetical protein